MVDVKDATNKSVEYLKNFFPEAKDIRLEEIEITEDKKFWNITLSYESYTTGLLMIGMGRSLKTFKLDTESGDVLSMKIRELK